MGGFSRVCLINLRWEWARKASFTFRKRRGDLGTVAVRFSKFTFLYIIQSPSSQSRGYDVRYQWSASGKYEKIEKNLATSGSCCYDLLYLKSHTMHEIVKLGL